MSPGTKRQRVLASRPERTKVDVNACTCGAIVFAADPEERDGWTRQDVDWKKKRPGAKSGHLGHLFESQKVSECQIKEFANVEKLKVAERDLRTSTSGGWTMRREERRKILLQTEKQ